MNNWRGCVAVCILLMPSISNWKQLGGPTKTVSFLLCYLSHLQSRNYKKKWLVAHSIQINAGD